MAELQVGEFQVWLIVDEDGEYAVGRDSDDVVEDYANDVGEIGEHATRRVCVTVRMPLPAPVEVSVSLGECPAPVVEVSHG